MWRAAKQTALAFSVSTYLFLHNHIRYTSHPPCLIPCSPLTLPSSSSLPHVTSLHSTLPLSFITLLHAPYAPLSPVTPSLPSLSSLRFPSYLPPPLLVQMQFVNNHSFRIIPKYVTNSLSKQLFFCTRGESKCNNENEL